MIHIDRCEGPFPFGGVFVSLVTSTTHKIAGNALGWSSLLMQSTRCTGRFHRSFHHGYLTRVRGFTAFFRARNFSSSEARLRTCFNRSRKRENSFAPFFFYSFIPVVRREIGLYKLRVFISFTNSIRRAKCSIARWQGTGRGFFRTVLRLK